MGNIKMMVSLLTFAIFSYAALNLNTFAAIADSKHDFSAWNSEGEVCVVCHTPHHAATPIAPLWNHATTTATFSVYSSSTLNASVPQPSSSSKTCLSCHDGTVAYDAYGGKPGIYSPITGSANVGTNLSNDHPISFTYNSALAIADGDLADPTVKTVVTLGGKTIDAGMLVAHRLECSSCHDVHKNKGDSGTAASLLLVDNSNSALCFTCHNK